MLESEITREAHQIYYRIGRSFAKFLKSLPLGRVYYKLHFQCLHQYIALKLFMLNMVHTLVLH